MLAVVGRGAVLLVALARAGAVEEDGAAVLGQARVRVVVEDVVGEDEVALAPQLQAVLAELVQPAVLAEGRVDGGVRVAAHAWVVS